MIVVRLLFVIVMAMTPMPKAQNMFLETVDTAFGIQNILMHQSLLTVANMKSGRVRVLIDRVIILFE